ncbi:MAG: prolipoprotein diacylglyceryl transferase [Propionibacteriaceae bacterium]|nr:prolipoprotein diacylglyceryl transferase [Propionibacteriaceae bacterium]
MPLYIPSPSIRGFDLGPLNIKFYALCLIVGIIVAWIIGVRRFRARGGTTDAFETCMIWAIPIGIVGARFYHVLTHLGDYFGAGINPWSVFFIWEGGIAIYGAVGFGALGAYIGCRRTKSSFAMLADALAPGIAVGQAIGRLGNWFNQELYGLPTELPWGLEIDPAHRVAGYENFATFHPTFLYELLWDLAVAAILIWLGNRLKLAHGQVFALYIALYGFGRFFTEGIRLDYSYDVFGPIRFNQAMAIVICLAGVALFVILTRRHRGDEAVETGEKEPEESAAEAEVKDADTADETAAEAATSPDVDDADAQEAPDTVE